MGPFLLSLFGGLLILLEGGLLLVAGSILGSAGYSALGAVVGIAGGLLALVGFVVLLLAIGVFLQPTAHTGFGIAILVLSLLSFLAGGGFYLGGILGVIGGILAITFKASDSEPGPGTAVKRVSIRDQTCKRCGKLFSGDVPECPFCHAPG